MQRGQHRGAQELRVPGGVGVVEQRDQQPVRPGRPDLVRPPGREVRGASPSVPSACAGATMPAAAEDPPRVDPPVVQLRRDQAGQRVHRGGHVRGHRPGQLQVEVGVAAEAVGPGRVPVALPQPGQPGRQQPAGRQQQVPAGVEQLLQQRGQRRARAGRLPGQQFARPAAPGPPGWPRDRGRPGRRRPVRRWRARPAATGSPPAPRPARRRGCHLGQQQDLAGAGRPAPRRRRRCTGRPVPTIRVAPE